MKDHIAVMGKLCGETSVETVRNWSMTTVLDMPPQESETMRELSAGQLVWDDACKKTADRRGPSGNGEKFLNGTAIISPGRSFFPDGRSGHIPPRSDNLRGRKLL